MTNAKVPYHWTDAEEEELRRQFGERAVEEICIAGRDADSITRKLKRMGLLVTKPSKPWTTVQLRYLQKLYGQGVTAQQMFKWGSFPGRTLQALISAMSDLGLVDSEKSARISAGIKEAQALDRSELAEFVQANFGKMTARDMAKARELSEGIIRTVMKGLGLKFTRADVRKMPKNRAASRRRINNNRAKMVKSRRKNLRAKYKTLLAEWKETRKISRKRRLECKKCLEKWPKDEKYFAVRKPKGRKPYFEGTCRLCRRKVK